ncbi:MAG: DUF4214 domain-containing protein [Ferrovum myxofaciens]
MGGTTATATDVENAYLAYFGRPADPEGMNYWLGQSIATMQAGFAASQEYQTLYGNMTNKQVVTQVYSNLLGRAPDTGGLAYWVNQLNIGAATVSTIVTQMQANAEGIDIATLANRSVFAIHFTEDLTSQSQIEGYSGTAAANAARVAVSQVLNTSSSLATAESNMALDIQAVDQGESPVTLAATNAAAATAASNLASYGSINGVTQTSAANTVALSSGSNTVTMVVGSSAVTDTFTVNSGTTALIINDSGSATGALTIGWAGTPTNLASVTVNDSSAAALNLNAVSDNALTSLTLNNTGSGTLTAANLIDNNSTLTFYIQGSGTVTETSLTLTDASLTVKDSSSVGQNLVAFTDSSAVGSTAFVLDNSGGALLTASGVTDANTGALTVSDTSTSGAVTISALTLSGTGAHTITNSGGTAETITTLNDSSGGVLALNAGASSSITVTNAVTDNTATSITFTGDVVGSFTDGLVAGATLDASAGTGALTLVGGAGADTIKGGSATTTIDGKAGANTITLLSGHSTVDTINVTSAVALTNYDTVSNFSVSNGDLIALGTAGAGAFVVASATAAGATASGTTVSVGTYTGVAVTLAAGMDVINAVGMGAISSATLLSDLSTAATQVTLGTSNTGGSGQVLVEYLSSVDSNVHVAALTLASTSSYVTGGATALTHIVLTGQTSALAAGNIHFIA